MSCVCLHVLSLSVDKTVQPACYDTGKTTANTAHRACFGFMSPHSVAADTVDPDTCAQDNAAGPLLSERRVKRQCFKTD